MLYRSFGQTGEKVSALSFGCMRLPVIDNDLAKINEEEATRMVHHAIDNGVNYFDTAYVYHYNNSEPFLGRALQNGYREKVFIATKLPSWLIRTAEDMDRIFDEQRERLQTDVIDFYLVHNLNNKYYTNLKPLGLFNFLDKLLSDGKVRYVGFSFHDGLPLFKELVGAYPWSFCQIQYNYLDENYQAGTEGLMYAAYKGLGVVAMEPLRGGKLAAGFPAEIQEIWDEAPVKREPVDWALRFLWDKPEISTVLSGMSTMQHVVDNLRYVENGTAGCMTKEDKDLLGKVKAIYNERIVAHCTSCGYCMPCPSGVDIPTGITLLNNVKLFDDLEGAKRIANILLNDQNNPALCIECGECLEKCPQHIKIPETLKQSAEVLGYS